MVIYQCACRGRQATTAINPFLYDRLHAIWDGPDLQRVWQYVHSNLTPKELTAEFNRRKAHGLTTGSASVREGAAIARVINSDSDDRVVKNFHNAIHAALGKRFGFDVPPKARPQLQQATIRFLRNRSDSQGKGRAPIPAVSAKNFANQGEIPTIRGRRPINSKYAGQTHPSGIKFTGQAFADFRPHAIAQVEIEGLTGIYDIDARKANKAAGLTATPDGCVWHHVHDGKTMQLIPRRVHKGARHTGGSAVIRNGGLDE